MTTTSGLQERLHNQADAELKKTVHEAIAQLQRSLIEAFPSQWPQHAEIKLGKDLGEIKYGYESLMKRVEGALIENLKEWNRENVVQMFMKKVDTLHEQIDELRDEMQYDG